VLTVQPSDISAMTAAVRDRARRDAGFAARVDTAVLTVLRSKHDSGLLSCAG
jgi:hypothetical protein